MTRRILWQAVLAILGIALIFIILVRLVRSVPQQVTVEVPVAGGTYIEGILGYSDAINPILAPAMVQANPVDQDLSALVFDGLTSLDETGHISPCLALEWTVSQDGTIYDFNLRRDVIWHDGAPFTAADVAFTVQAMQDPNYQGASALRELWRNVAVEQPAPFAVRFVLQEPFPSFLYYTTIGILPAHLLSSVPAADLPAQPFSKDPVGTGMFMTESVSPERIVLAANPHYWGAKPFLERIEIRFFGDWESLLQSYEQDEIHGFHPPQLQDLPGLMQYPDLRFYSAQEEGYGIVFLNLKRESVPFFAQKEVRQALLYALDRQLLIDGILKGQGLIADSPIPPITWAYDPSVRQYRYDPERAIGLLDASGWLDTDGDRLREKEGTELAFTLLTSDDLIMTQLAEEMVRQWQAVGVKVTIRSVTNEAATHFVLSRNFDAALAEIGLTADPDPYPLWHSTQAELGQNFSGFANEDADVVLEEGRHAADLKRRAELYRTFQQIFAEEIPSLLIYYPIYTYAVDAEVREVQLSPLLRGSDRFRNIRDWYIQTEEVVVSESDQLDKPGE